MGIRFSTLLTKIKLHFTLIEFEIDFFSLSLKKKLKIIMLNEDLYFLIFKFELQISLKTSKLTLNNFLCFTLNIFFNLPCIFAVFLQKQ